MNACFDNLISIADTCNDVTPSSGITMKQVGITLSEANDFINSDYESGIDLINEKIDFATKIVTDRIVNHFSDKVKAASIIDNARLGFFKDNLVVKAGEAGYKKGIKLELKNTASYFDVYISEISMLVDFTGTFNVQVYDLIQNKLLDTISVTTVAGNISTTYVNKTYKSNKKKLSIVLIYDTTTINAYDTEVKQNFCSSCSGSYIVQINQHLNAGGVKILTSDTKILDNVTAIADTAGMSIIYSISCDQESWVCAYSNLMALSIAFKTAYLIMAYAIQNSERSNTKTFDPEKLQQRMQFYDFEYNKSQGNLLKNIKIPVNDVCFECNSRTRHVFAM